MSEMFDDFYSSLTTSWYWFSFYIRTVVSWNSELYDMTGFYAFHFQGLCIYHLLVWWNFWHSSLWSTLSTQSCLFLYFLCHLAAVIYEINYLISMTIKSTLATFLSIMVIIILKNKNIIMIIIILKNKIFYFFCLFWHKNNNMDISSNKLWKLHVKTKSWLRKGNLKRET